MPMPINSMDEYEKVIDVGWYNPETERQDLQYTSRKSLSAESVALISRRFPLVLPFSQMYPLCCIDIRNFLNQFYFFSDEYFQHPGVIDETLKKVRLMRLPRLKSGMLTRASLLMSFSLKKCATH
jgi:exocyst complex component 6